MGGQHKKGRALGSRCYRSKEPLCWNGGSQEIILIFSGKGREAQPHTTVARDINCPAAFATPWIRLFIWPIIQSTKLVWGRLRAVLLSRSQQDTQHTQVVGCHGQWSSQLEYLVVMVSMWVHSGDLTRARWTCAGFLKWWLHPWRKE